MKKLIWLFFLPFFACSCEKDTPVAPDEIKNEEGVVTAKKELWKIPLTNVNQYVGMHVETPIVYNDGVMMGANQGGNECFRMVNVYTGATMWQKPVPQGVSSYISSDYQKGGTLLIAKGFNIPNLNLETGELNWQKKHQPSLYNRISAVGDTFFVWGGDPYNNGKWGLTKGFYGDVRTGEITEFLEAV